MMLGTAAMRSTVDTSVDLIARRGVVGDEERERQREGEAHDQRHEGDLDRPDEDGGDADPVELGLPLRLGEEVQTVVVQGRNGLVAEEDPDGAHHAEDEQTGRPGAATEHTIGAVQLGRELARHHFVPGCDAHPNLPST